MLAFESRLGEPGRDGQSPPGRSPSRATSDGRCDWPSANRSAPWSWPIRARPFAGRGQTVPAARSANSSRATSRWPICGAWGSSSDRARRDRRAVPSRWPCDPFRRTPVPDAQAPRCLAMACCGCSRLASVKSPCPADRTARAAGWPCSRNRSPPCWRSGFGGRSSPSQIDRRQPCNRRAWPVTTPTRRGRT